MKWLLRPPEPFGHQLIVNFVNALLMRKQLLFCKGLSRLLHTAGRGQRYFFIHSSKKIIQNRLSKSDKKYSMPCRHGRQMPEIHWNQLGKFGRIQPQGTSQQWFHTDECGRWYGWHMQQARSIDEDRPSTLRITGLNTNIKIAKLLRNHNHLSKPFYTWNVLPHSHSKQEQLKTNNAEMQ